jgi:hypothetical protein
LLGIHVQQSSKDLAPSDQVSRERIAGRLGGTTGKSLNREVSRKFAMTQGKPWFLIMTPGDANRAGSEWKREHASSHGKIVARPIAREGWIALAAFVALWTTIPMVIWLGGYLGGSLSLIGAIVATVIAEAAIIGGFVLLAWTKSTRLET